MLYRAALTLNLGACQGEDTTARIAAQATACGLGAALRQGRLATPALRPWRGVAKTLAAPAAVMAPVAPERVILQALLTPQEIIDAGRAGLGAGLRGDIPIGAMDVWTPFASGGGLFGTRRHAHDLIGAAAAPDADAGRGVQVVILDYGLSNEWLRRHRASLIGQDTGISGGWSRYGRESGGGQWFHPGALAAGRSEHGHMIARNILALAPAAAIWDVPLLPDTVLGPPGIALAEAIFQALLRDISTGMQHTTDDAATPVGRLPKGPWILVNAWGALDPQPYDEMFAAARYSDNPDHHFVEDMPKFAAPGVDLVFAAGNCGSPGAMPLCGEGAIGPGGSIHGVNAHPSVLTVGAVRVDGVPVGGSAQGPGALSRNWARPLRPMTPDQDHPGAKPDIACPSHFREEEDGQWANTGTSAACGMAAGMLAVLRGREVAAGLWEAGSAQAPRTPEAMRAILRSTAQPGSAAGWDARIGWGIAHLGAARARLAL